jgi:hypothetical protein
VTGANRLNCTANDVRISGVARDDLGEPLVEPSTCIEGETFDLTATFEVEVTAATRYDLAFLFGIGGQDDARDPTGTCSLSALDPNENPGDNLDGLDTCGDLNAGTYEATFTIPGVLCEGVEDPVTGDFVLRLPNCTSWHSNQATTCNITSASTFAPDTKSKCLCNDDFTLPVLVETAELVVTKTAEPTMVFEPGGEVTYTVDVLNDAEFVSVTIDSVDDDIYGDVASTTNTAINSTTCDALLGTELGPQESASCTFTADVTGDFGDDPVIDVVEVCALQNEDLICGDDDATVTIENVSETPVAEKAATLDGCTVEVDYTVSVINNSDIDSLTIDTLVDDQFGNLQDPDNTLITDTTCDLLTSVDPGGTGSCTFTAAIDSPDCDFSHVDTVNATGADEDNVPFDVDTNPVTVSVGGVTINPTP